MANPDNFSQFLASVEKRAFGMAVVSVKNADDALDIVQDAMFTLARKYSEKNSSEWAPIFYRVLNNRITDFHRSNSRRAGLFGWFGFGESSGQDELEQVAGPAQHNPEFIQELDSDTRLLLEAVALLPVRQQQAFLLRAWEGMDVKNTAKSMNCSEGSVKTHYSRAVHALRENLGEALQGEDDE